MARLANVNTTDIAAAVTLACRRMHRAEVTDLHNGGRYLNALLHAGDLLGVEVDEGYVDRLAAVVFDAYSLPSQLRDARFLVEGAAPDKVEETRRWADSLLGAYGFPAPYGHDPVGNRLGIRFNLDVVGGTADYRERTT